MPDWAAVARVIDERMAERGMTQRELAERSGVSTATLRAIKHGGSRRLPTTLAAISRALGLPDDQLRRTAFGDDTAAADDGPQQGAVAELRGQVADLGRRVEAIESRLGRDAPAIDA